MAESIALNCDCMEYMKTLPDNAFDLAVVDPPYGDAMGGDGSSRFGGMFAASISGEATRTQRIDNLHSSCRKRERERAEPQYNRFGNPGSRFEKYKREADGWCVGGETRKKIIAWDVAPGKDYFDELFRVSREQIIWGGNYFDLPPTRCFVIYRKTNIPADGFTMAPVEYAWTSFNRNAVYIEAFAQGRPGAERFHPTQKPVLLYQRLFEKFAKPGDRIIDTHLGSGSSRIAAYDAGLDFVGCEIDKTYFDKQEERFAAHAAQQNLFLMG